MVPPVLGFGGTPESGKKGQLPYQHSQIRAPTDICHAQTDPDRRPEEDESAHPWPHRNHVVKDRRRSVRLAPDQTRNGETGGAPGDKLTSKFRDRYGFVFYDKSEAGEVSRKMCGPGVEAQAYIVAGHYGRPGRAQARQSQKRGGRPKNRPGHGIECAVSRQSVAERRQHGGNRRVASQRRICLGPPQPFRQRIPHGIAPQSSCRH